MTTSSRHIEVGTTPTRLDWVDSDSADGMGTVTLLVRCPDAALFLGGQDVTAATGYELPAGDPYADQSPESSRPGDALYAVVATGTASVHVLRRG